MTTSAPMAAAPLAATTVDVRDRGAVAAMDAAGQHDDLLNYVLSGQSAITGLAPADLTRLRMAERAWLQKVRERRLAEKAWSDASGQKRGPRVRGWLAVSFRRAA